MTTYYVRKTGSDAANGLTPATAWLTIGKALGAAGIASGDTCYVGAGVYRETVSVAMVSATAETKVIGDIDGSHTGDPGEVQWTAYTTNDKTAPGTVPLVLVGRDFLTFQNIVFIGGSSNLVQALTTTSTDIKFQDCLFNNLRASSGTAVFRVVNAAGVALNWLIERCIFVQRPSSSSGYAILFALARHTVDYDVNFVVRDCTIVGGTDAFEIGSSGSGAGFAGGVVVYNVMALTTASLMRVTDANIATSIPCKVYNSVGSGVGVGLNANAAGQIVEDYNLLYYDTPRTNVTAGAHSISDGSYAPLLELGQAQLQGRRPRPYLSPAAGSPLLNFGAQAGGPTDDLIKGPRPAGGGGPNYAVGPYERANTAAKETGTVRTGANALAFTGPGYQDFQLPVIAGAQTPKVWARFDSTYAGTKPSVSVLNGGEIGVADATVTMTAAADTWEQVSLPITASAAGYVTVRLRSSDTNGAGKAFFDDWTAA